jgi:hypothetical protein
VLKYSSIDPGSWKQAVSRHYFSPLKRTIIIRLYLSYSADVKHNPSKTACEHQQIVRAITRVRRTSSYRATGVVSLINFSPSQRIPAVMPLPQVVVTRRWPSRISPAFSVPTASSSFRWSSLGGRNVEKVAPEWWPEFFCRNALNGRENECGI